jgi:hypothetical protein
MSMSLTIFKEPSGMSLVLERTELFYSKAQLKKDGVWKSEPLERELWHKRSQNRL